MTIVDELGLTEPTSAFVAKRQRTTVDYSPEAVAERKRQKREQPTPAAPHARRTKRVPKNKVPLSEQGAIENSEDALALQFAAEHVHEFRFTPGMGWMACTGPIWESDQRLHRFERAREVCRAKAVSADDAKEAGRLSSAKTVAAVLSLAQSDPLLATPTTSWDSNPFELNTPLTVVNLSTGHSAPPGSALFTQVTRVTPKAENTPCPAWQAFVEAVFLQDVEMIEFVQRLLGYLLSADRSEQKVFFFYGLGANGKSTLVDLVAWIMGSYAIKLPATVLMQSSMERHPTELAQLRGKRLAVSSELDDGAFWAEARIKELTGDEVLTARFMRQDFFEFAMTQTHVIVGNYKPRLRGGDAALARRFILVPFLAKFEGSQRDPNMLAKLRAEAPAILAWMIQGAVKWRNHGLGIPSSVTAASKDYLAENDDVVLWLTECCEFKAEARTKAADMYGSFSSWIKSRGQHAPSMRLFGDRMSVVPGVTKLQSNGVRYLGVRLTEEESCRLAATSYGVSR